MNLYATVLVVCFMLCCAISPTVGSPPFYPGIKYIGYWGANAGSHQSTLTQLNTALTKGYNTVIYAFYLVDSNGELKQDRMYLSSGFHHTD